jgi:VWFA-related protein
MKFANAALLACCLLSAGAWAQTAGLPDKAPDKQQDGGFTTPALESGNTPPQKVFKASTRLVVVDVVVTDKHGAPVQGLKREDFELMEGGHPQTLKVFEERKSQGIYTAAPTVKAEGGQATATNAGQENAGPALNVILFDALDTASSDQSFARSQVKKVIQQLPPGSRIAIFVLRNDLHMVQGFTTDTALLAAAMEKDKSALSGPWFNDPDMALLSQGADPAAGMGGSMGGAGSVAGLGSTLSGNSTPGQMGPTSYLGNVAQRDEEGLTSQLRTAKTFAALNAMARYLAVLPGRKNLLWLAGVFPFDLLPDTSNANPDPFRGTHTYNDALHDLAMQMESGHIAVYPIDVRGVADEGVFGAAGGGRPTLTTVSAATGAQLSQQEVMENIAHETGGRAIYNDNDIRGEIIETLNQGGNFYTLAYSPEDKNWNGKYRKIEVKTGLKDVHLFYRHGYIADDPDKPGQQVAPESVPKFSVAMLHGAPERAEVVMTVKASGTGQYVEEKDRKPQQLLDRQKPMFEYHLSGTTEVYAVSCTIDAKTVAFQKGADGKYTPHLALTFLAYDADGKVLNAVPGVFSLPLTAAQYKAVLQRGLTVTQQMDVPMGRAWLRVGVHDLQNDKVGATELPLVVTRANAQTAMAK